jgi:glycosyltransferase involved in cell wall biosynthesis
VTGSDSRRPPTVSVLMAVREPHPEYFPAAVGSILAQTFGDFELLVVEDPSPRPAAPLLAGLNDPRLQHLVNPRRTSLVAQRNRGLAEARGEFVAVMDADDVAEPHRLQEQVAFLRTHPEIVVVGSHVHLIDPAGRLRGNRRFPTSHDEIVRALPRFVPLSQPSVVARREVLVRAGGYRDTGFGAAEDYELWSRLARGGARFANLPEPLLRYRLHPGQMKATHLRQTIRGILHVKGLYWADRQGWSGRLRLWGERLLLCLPPGLVLRLLLAARYSGRVPRPLADRTPAEVVTGLAAQELLSRPSPALSAGLPSL